MRCMQVCSVEARLLLALVVHDRSLDCIAFRHVSGRAETLDVVVSARQQLRTDLGDDAKLDLSPEVHGRSDDSRG